MRKKKLNKQSGSHYVHLKTKLRKNANIQVRDGEYRLWRRNEMDEIEGMSDNSKERYDMWITGIWQATWWVWYT